MGKFKKFRIRLGLAIRLLWFGDYFVIIPKGRTGVDMECNYTINIYVLVAMLRNVFQNQNLILIEQDSNKKENDKIIVDYTQIGQA